MQVGPHIVLRNPYQTGLEFPDKKIYIYRSVTLEYTEVENVNIPYIEKMFAIKV